MSSSEATTQFTGTSRHPQIQATQSDSGWWLGLLGPVCIGLTLVAVCVVSMLSF